jgi:hypothetical protein
MSRVCPVCDKKIDSTELYDEHMLEHVGDLNQNSTKESDENFHTTYSYDEKISQVDLSKIFSGEKFEKLTEKKILQIIDDRERLNRQNFVEKIKKINEKNPFIYLPHFLDDFIQGMPTHELEDKYHIWNWMDHRVVTHNILEFNEYRYISTKYDDPLELNLKNFEWRDKYKNLEDNCKFFKDELKELIFNNVLYAGIIFLLMDKELEQKEIVGEIERIKDHYDLYNFLNTGGYTSQKLIDDFDNLLETDLENRIDSILSSLKQESVIKRAGKGTRRLITGFNMDSIKKNILQELKSKNRLSYISLRNLMTEKFPGLRLIPKFNVFESSWRELESEEEISIEYVSSKRNDFVFFLNETHKKISIDIHNIEVEQKKIPFVGRKIDADQFIIELLELDKGDFDDADDQVTRMAGLVLAESVKIQSPHEKISDFDFTIDIKNYDFRPEQLEAIAKLNFKINSEILHVKVMIDEKLSFKKYLELKNKIPLNEQGTIITFQALSAQIKNDMKNDATIQIIDEEGVRIWVSITPQIPARVNSISKITFDPLSKLENKIVKVSSVFYETGFAIVNVFPEMNEETVLARTLEEIPLFVGGANNFNEYADMYSDFLTTLFTTSSYDDVIDGIFKNEFKDVSNSVDFFKFEFDYNVVELNFSHYNKRDIFNCNCIKYAENNLNFCKHMITALDYLFRYHSKQNEIREKLEIWITANISIILDRLDVTEENDANAEVADFIFGKLKLMKDL